MKTSEFCRFVLSHSFSYNYFCKELFLREARSFLRRLAKDLRLAPDSFEIRTNRGGIAGSGEVILHHDHVYIFVDEGVNFGQGKAFYWRTCEDRKDFTGGTNRWVTFAELATTAGYDRFLGAIEAALAGARPELMAAQTAIAATGNTRIPSSPL